MKLYQFQVQTSHDSQGFRQVAVVSNYFHPGS